MSQEGHTAKSDRADGHLHAEEIDNALSTQQLCRVIAGRLRALGAAPLLHASASETPRQATWTTAWNAKVTQLVP